ncbi:putative amidoligase enzyme-domain-containing protein [Xylariaceae sp. FL1651]|nr:putative amidoligase enzyme-domain-containing protein [Xylariaceae sp. FL1651]
MGFLSKDKSSLRDSRSLTRPAGPPPPPLPLGGSRQNRPPAPPPPPTGRGAPRLGSQVSTVLRPLPAQIPVGTIGISVETKFKLHSRHPAASDSSLRLFARTLAAGHNRAVHPSNPRIDSLVQNLLVHDPTCKTRSSPWGIKMVSPIFRLMPNSSWRSANYKVTADETYSTHVHMSIAGNYSAHQLKRLAQAIIYFEPAFEALLPRDRRGNEYAKSKWIDNQHFGYARVSRVDAIAMLERCAKVEDVIELINPQDTIEFRRGAASTTSAKVFRWVEIATSFLRASLKMLDPIPVRKLSPEKKKKKLEKKIQLDLKSNPMLDNVAAAKSQGLI